MKKEILRALGVVVTLALMLTILPASIASAAVVNTLVVINTQGTLATNPYYGQAKGQAGNNFSFTITGSPTTNFTVYFSNQKANVGDDIGTEVTTYKQWEGVALTSDGGSVQITTLSIPSSLTDGPVNLTSLHGGIYYFYVVQYYPTSGSIPAYNDTNILKVAEFEIVGIADATIDKTSGKVGTIVTVEGSGYAPGEYLMVNYYHTSTSYILIEDFLSGNDQVASNGTFSLSFAIPDSIYGNHTIKVEGETSRATESFTFSVTPSITLSKASGYSGENVIVYAKGFARNSDVDIFIGNIKLDIDDSSTVSDKTNTFGNLEYNITIPSSLSAGTYNITVRDEATSTINATAQFEVILASELSISKNSGNVGDAVTVNGTKYAVGSTVTILYDGVSIGTATTDAAGNFTLAITIPESTYGAHIIKVGNSQATFNVIPKISLDKTQGIAGTTITVTGTGFAGSTVITAKFNNATVALNSTVTNANGCFSASFVVPAVATGTYAVEVTAGPTLSTNFTIVDAAITLNANSGEVGDTITVTGANFAAGSNITLTIDGVAIPNMGTITAGATGDFTVAFNIPTIAGGPHTIAVSDGTTTKSAQFTVTARASLTPTSGNVGSAVTVSGSGFSASAMLTIKYNGTVVATGTLPVTGAFANATFTVPASPGGARTVEVTDGINTVQLTFAMETTPPPAPTLTLPLQASKEKGIVTFDWSDVTDLSLPVTYTLQVATDSSFSNIFVNVAGLTASTYTLTDAQKLSKLPDNGQYYWRVIATDGASNSSTSSVNTFVVGGGLPSWLMWVWIGIGVVVVFIFAIWLGRRMAYSAY